MFVGTSRCPVSDAQPGVRAGFFAASFFRLTSFVRGEPLQAVTSVREPAENFDKRSGALVADGRRTRGDVSQAVNNRDRNPTRLLFGAVTAATPASALAREAKPGRNRPSEFSALSVSVSRTVARDLDEPSNCEDFLLRRGLRGNLLRRQCWVGRGGSAGMAALFEGYQ
jgi:hypothetical protein